MPRDPNLKRVFLIGSGPIVIGQGCEFDYSGTQACKALREEGCQIVLLNSNPATIMTDKIMADATYIAPMTIEACIEIIKKERPDALLPTLGGQTALNLAVELSKRGILEEYKVKLIGASLESIEKAENRKLFREAMNKIGLETTRAYSITHRRDLDHIEQQLNFPMMIRTSFTLGGLGSGIVYNAEELHQQAEELFSNDHFQCFEVEEALIGWKEFEMEAIRDCADNCIIVCSLENVDPMGVHTGDSITVAPAMTLCNKEYQRMRRYTFDVLREIGVDTGGANVQFAVHPKTGRMLVIEMNPRVSRSSALASKATGYPIAKIATKLALGYTLDELTNSLTSTQIPASFEPTIDYVVTKLPRFNFEKFPKCDGVLTTKMQSTGEVIGIGRNFQESLQKAVCSLEKNVDGLEKVQDDILKKFGKPYIDSIKDEYTRFLQEKLSKPYHNRLFYIAEAFRLGWRIDEIYPLTFIDPWFLEQLSELISIEISLHTKNINAVSRSELFNLKRKGFSDAFLAKIFHCHESDISSKRVELNVLPVFKRVDSCAAEFPVRTAFLYSTYEMNCEAQPNSRKKIMILGSGPNRIGQGIEFDYGSVHAALTARDLGYETIMINSNPETVSTDYDIVDRLYLEPLTLEHVLNVIELEKPTYVVTQFGGQTALNLVDGLNKVNVPLLGTSAHAIDVCENRDLFKNKLIELGIKQPANFCVQVRDVLNCSTEIDKENDKENEIQKMLIEDFGIHFNGKYICYPIIIRPSYLLSGSSMQIIRSKSDLIQYLNLMTDKKYFPVLIEEFLEEAIEAEVDGVCDGVDVFIPGVMEQIELAGVHSGDSACCFPAHTLSLELQNRIIEQSKEMALALQISGLFNIQFAIKSNEIYVIEVNPRSSRTVPFLSKALGVSLPDIAMRCLLGKSLKEQNYFNAIPNSIQQDYFSIKIPVFPLDRLGAIELGPEMRSTGEGMYMQEKYTTKIDIHNYEHLELICLQELA